MLFSGAHEKVSLLWGDVERAYSSKKKETVLTAQVDDVQRVQVAEAFIDATVPTEVSDTSPAVIPREFIAADFAEACDGRITSDMVCEVARIIDADIRREGRDLRVRLFMPWQVGPFAPHIERPWETKVAEAEVIFEALGSPALGSTVIVSEALVRRVMPVAHVGVIAYLARHARKPVHGAVRFGGYCNREVQTGMTVDLVRAFGCKAPRPHGC